MTQDFDEEPVRDLQIQLAEAQAAVYVPGQWRCAKCGFELTKSIIGVKSGNIAPDLSKAEPCPNDGEPLERATWKSDAMRLSDRCLESLQRERKLQEENDSLRRALGPSLEDTARLDHLLSNRCVPVKDEGRNVVCVMHYKTTREDIDLAMARAKS